MKGAACFSIWVGGRNEVLLLMQRKKMVRSTTYHKRDEFDLVRLQGWREGEAEVVRVGHGVDCAISGEGPMDDDEGEDEEKYEAI